MSNSLAIVALSFFAACSTDSHRASSPPALVTHEPTVKRVIPVRFVAAQGIADALNDLLTCSRNAAEARSAGFCALYPPGHDPSLPEPMRILVDAGTNSIVV